MAITVLAGGVGSARFCAGLVRVVNPDDLTIVVNTGDDEQIRGLWICPDIDTVLYHLAGACDWDRGWGLADETTVANDRYRELAAGLDGMGLDLQEWFTLGDRDLATHLLRLHLLEHDLPLTEVTDALRLAMGIECQVLPVSDDPVRTVLRTAGGEWLDFQEYFVRRKQEPEVTGIEVEGVRDAAPAPGVLEAIEDAEVLIVPPSNPLISVGPLLAVPGVRDAVEACDATCVAVSPIVGGRALKGPADRLMTSLGHEVSAVGVARIYRGLVDVFVLDEQDAGLAGEVEELGMEPVVCDTLMRSAEDAGRVAKAVLDAVG